MIKKLCLIGICAMAFSAQADITTYGPCAGGTGVIVKGLNGTNYCLSNIEINWYSAFSWCEAAGGHLAGGSEACDYGAYKWHAGYCYNGILMGEQGGKQYAWLGNAQSGSYAYLINSQPTSSTTQYAEKLKPLHALCAGNY